MTAPAGTATKKPQVRRLRAGEQLGCLDLVPNTGDPVVPAEGGSRAPLPPESGLGVLTTEGQTPPPTLAGTSVSGQLPLTFLHPSPLPTSIVDLPDPQLTPGPHYETTPPTALYPRWELHTELLILYLPPIQPSSRPPPRQEFLALSVPLAGILASLNHPPPK